MGDSKQNGKAGKKKWACSKAECEKNLHSFLTKTLGKSGMIVAKKAGTCIYCGADLVDWMRVQKRDIADVNYTFNALKYEWVRHAFWHTPFDQYALNHARRKGKIRLKEAAEQRIQSSVGKAKGDNSWDGRQTPWEGNTLFYAQHATATCCRNCIKRWHGVPADRDLTEEEINYLTKLVVRYIDDRLPELKDEGEKVPPIKKNQKVN